MLAGSDQQARQQEHEGRERQRLEARHDERAQQAGEPDDEAGHREGFEVPERYAVALMPAKYGIFWKLISRFRHRIERFLTSPAGSAALGPPSLTLPQAGTGLRAVTRASRQIR